MQELSVYYQLFPGELHRRVDKLINYLTYFPFEQPEHCPRCGSTSFYSRRPTQQQIMVYCCYACDKEFNRLTGTLFARSRFMNVWGEFAKARFSGKTIIEISSLLGMSYQAVRYRDKVLMDFLEQDYPDLYAWWKPYQEREEKYIKNNKVRQEAKVLTDWLTALLTTDVQICPQCADRQMRKLPKQRLSFVCDKCETFINLLTGTALHKLRHMDKWQAFTELLIQGDSDSDISRKLAITLQTSKRWRVSFLHIIKDKKLDNLHEWIVWQRHRRACQAIKLGHSNKK